MRFDHERSFFENRRNCSPSVASELYGGGLFIKFNSYSFNFNGGLRKHRAGYCLLRTPWPERQAISAIFENWRLAIFIAFISSDWIKLLYFYMCLLRKNFLICVQIWIILMQLISVNVTPKKWCFFWRSVYIYIYIYIFFFFFGGGRCQWAKMHRPVFFFIRLSWFWRTLFNTFLL